MRKIPAGPPWELVVPVQHASRLMNANQRRHWRSRHAATKEWRQLAAVLAHNAVVRRELPTGLTAVHLQVTFAWPDRRRRDVANLAPTAKALVDGLVDAHVLVDDADEHITGPDLRRATGQPEIRVRIAPWDALW